MCLSTFLGFCEEHVNLHIIKTSHRVFLNFKKVKKVFLLLSYINKCKKFLLISAVGNDVIHLLLL